MTRVGVLAGGVGAARFLEGLVRVVPPEEVTVVANTGDDIDAYGVRVSPDPDIVTYTLAGIVDEEKGWGIEGDTSNALDYLDRLGHETWFQLGDRDLAVQLHRSAAMSEGKTLQEAVASIAEALGVETRILPMTNDRVTTTVHTIQGELTFEEYFVRERGEPEITGIAYENAEKAEPTPGVIEALEDGEAVLVAPSNPLASVGPILAVPGVRGTLRETPAPVGAVSPIVEGGTVKGPADRMMSDLGLEVSPVGVARLYADFLDAFVIDERDAEHADAIEEMGMDVLVTDTIMTDIESKERLASETLSHTRDR